MIKILRQSSSKYYEEEAGHSVAFSERSEAIWSYGNRYHLYRPLGNQIVTSQHVRIPEIIYENRHLIPEMKNVPDSKIINRHFYARTFPNRRESYTEVRLKDQKSDVDVLGRLFVTQKLSEPVVGRGKDSSGNQHVVFLLTVSGRVGTLERFLTQWTAVAKQDPKVGLFVTIFKTSQAELENQRRRIELLKSELEQNLVEYKVLDGNFVRGRGLDEGIRAIKGSPIVFFCDVDMLFSAKTVAKLRFHTRPGIGTT